MKQKIKTWTEIIIYLCFVWIITKNENFSLKIKNYFFSFQKIRKLTLILLIGCSLDDKTRLMRLFNSEAA